MPKNNNYKFMKQKAFAFLALLCEKSCSLIDSAQKVLNGKNKINVNIKQEEKEDE